VFTARYGLNLYVSFMLVYGYKCFPMHTFNPVTYVSSNYLPLSQNSDLTHDPTHDSSAVPHYSSHHAISPMCFAQYTITTKKRVTSIRHLTPHVSTAQCPIATLNPSQVSFQQRCCYQTDVANSNVQYCSAVALLLCSTHSTAPS
jgi:hypothetical protein